MNFGISVGCFGGTRSGLGMYPKWVWRVPAAGMEGTAVGLGHIRTESGEYPWHV